MCLRQIRTLAVALGVTLVAVAPRAGFAAKPGANPRRVVDACIRAEGGAKRLASLRSVEYQGTVTDSDGKAAGNYTLILERPNRLYQEVTIGSTTVREAYNGKSAWRMDGAGLRTVTGAEGTRLEAAAHYRNDRLAGYRKDKVRLRPLGEEDVRGHHTERLELTTPAGVKRQVAIDSASHLVVEELYPGSGSAPETNGRGAEAATDDERIFYDDYRIVDGIAEPCRIEFVAPDHHWVVTITRVLHNPPVRDAVFAFPALSNQPLPDIAALLHSVDAHQKAIEKLVEQYTCDKTSEEFEVDSHGATKSKVKEYQVFYLDGDEVDRLVKKDGKALSAAEQQKQSEHIQKVVADYQKRHAKEEAREKKGEPPKKRDDDISVSDFLRIDRFTHPRRETFRGHEVIVFDFEPNPDYKPAKTVERLLHELSGAVWIDEQDADVVRLEAHLTNSFKLAGGLFASLQKGSAFVFEQAKINDEVWLPSYLEAHVSARVLLLKGLSGNFTQRYSNYQKFRVEAITRQGGVKSNP